MAKLFPTVPWAKGSNIYEVNIRQYTKEGNFKAFQQHLPRLADMGVEILWLMPVTPISVEKRQGTLGSYYACSSYTDVNPEFGTPSDLKELVNDAHSRGMKLIIDWVANHTGWDHHWTQEHPDWYEVNAEGSFYDENGWIDVIDLDYSSKELRKEMIRSMQYWINEFDIDGFRCDMAHLVTLDFWIEARAACDRIKPLFWLAETDSLAYHTVFDASYAWAWMHLSLNFFQGHANMSQFRQALKEFRQLPDDSYKLMFTTNHDENSWNGTEYEKYGAAAKALAVLCCAFKALPLIYSGQEIPNNKRLKFFDKDEIDWSGSVQLHSFYQSLLKLRRDSPAVTDGNVHWLMTGADDHVLAYLLGHSDDVVLVVLNLSSSEKLKIEVVHPELKGTFENLFSGLQYPFDGHMSFELNPWEYHVYRKISS